MSKSLDAIVESFIEAGPIRTNDPRYNGGTVTIWLNKEHKAKFDRLQKNSRRKFARVVRQVVEVMIERADAA